MKITVIIIMFTVIAMLWAIAHILYKPIYDKIAKQYVTNEDDFKIANICIAVMLCLSFVIGLIV
jgi:Na+(H+)/acetate symporter ActP